MVTDDKCSLTAARGSHHRWNPSKSTRPSSAVGRQQTSVRPGTAGHTDAADGAWDAAAGASKKNADLKLYTPPSQPDPRPPYRSLSTLRERASSGSLPSAPIDAIADSSSAGASGFPSAEVNCAISVLSKNLRQTEPGEDGRHFAVHLFVRTKHSQKGRSIFSRSTEDGSAVP